MIGTKSQSFNHSFQMNHQPNIVILDGYTANPNDLSWDNIACLGTLSIYDRTSPEQLIERAKEAEILIINKCRIDRTLLSRLPQLKLICLSATGYNNIDIIAAKEKGVLVCNAANYGSASVAQHVFALILNHSNHVHLHNEGIHKGDWSQSIDWTYHQKPLIELAGQTLGIYGFGKIGQAVAKIALAFEMNVIAHRKNMTQSPPPNITYVDFETLLKESDFLSLNAPLTTENNQLINAENLAKMKKSSLLINTSRGGLINELELKFALENNIIAGAALDVLSSEPPAKNHPLLNCPNCVITPHHAWATRASRQRLLNIVAENIKAYLNGQPINVVNE